MHFDNQRLQSIQRFKALIQHKIRDETDPNEKQLWEQKLEEYTEEEKRILKDLDVKI